MMRLLGLTPSTAVDVRHLTKSQKIALSACLVAILIGFVFLSVRRQRGLELRHLYDNAELDSSSLAALAADHSHEATEYLEKLAQNRRLLSTVRVSALRALESRADIEQAAIAMDLSIANPFAVRHEAATLLLRANCDDSCISAALYSLNELWRGDVTSEGKLLRQHPSIDDAGARRIVAELRSQTEADYLHLLRLKPCNVRAVLQQENVVLENPSFARKVQGVIPCSR